MRPRSLDDLPGLRAARWIRESTAGQFDRFGPDSQRRVQDDFMRRHGLVDSGLEYHVAHSGLTVWKSPVMAEMLGHADEGRFDVLLTGYSDRWQRNLRRFLELIEDRLHPAGVSLVMCERRLLSTDPHDWDEMVDEAHGAEKYSRRLGERISDGYTAKFEGGDQGGNAPLGFRRVEGRLRVDPSIARVVRVFERYATGTVSLSELETETGIARDALRELLRNPIYNGWVRRRRRASDEQRKPAAWRTNPPVSDELWGRVQDVREARYHGGGHPTPRWTHLLAGRLFCVCGARLRADGRPINRRYRHFARCDSWTVSTRTAATLEGPIALQVMGIRHDAAMLVSLRRLAGVSRPDTRLLHRRRLERELTERAQRHARREITTETYLAEHSRLTAQMDEPVEDPVVDPDVAIRWLKDVKEMWREADETARAGLVKALYDRVVVTSERFVEVSPTPEAARHGLTLALPQVVRARRAGDGHTLTTIPVEGQDELRRMLRRVA